MAFRKLKGIKLPYHRQGYFYFLCKNTDIAPPEDVKRLKEICAEIAGENEQALYIFLTTGRSAVSVAMQFYIRENNLYQWRRCAIYRWFDKK